MATCPSCAHKNRDGAKFCEECGTPFQPAPAGEERKVITALFCDLVGSTALGERLDPEEIDHLLRDYYAIARKRIESFGGVVEKFIGDAVVGIFGVPAAHEDDPERAARAALGIVEDIDASRLDLQVRIGINTGETLVRAGVAPHSGEGFVTGDCLNTAARLEAIAPVMGVVVGELTYRATSRLFEFETLEPVSVKGKAEPVPIYRPIRPITHQSSELVADSTPFVGRDFELEALVHLLERSCATPSTEFVTVVGEPGIGKSRLVRELARHAEAMPKPILWRQGHCLPYGDGIGFWALGEIIKSHAGILDTDDQRTLSIKLDRSLAVVDPSLRGWMKDRLAPLVGLQITSQPPQQQEAFTAWRRFLEQVARDDPMVLVVEDLHWADDAFIAFLQHLAEHTSGLPLLVITTARPELEDRHPSWSSRARGSTVLSLTSLADPDMETLITSSLEGASPELIATVLDRAGGSPFYAEQLAAMAKDPDIPIAGGALDETSIPPTIQALLAARIDALPPELKTLLLEAAVVGNTFWSGAVAGLSERTPTDVEAPLAELGRRAFIRPAPRSTMEGESEFVFWHALMRDVAYSELPRAARMTKHRATAEWITERTGGALGESAEIVAEHYARALELAGVLRVTREIPEIREALGGALVAAADHAMGTQPSRSGVHLDRALELMDVGDPRRSDLLGRLGQALLATADFPEAVRALEEATRLLERRGEEVAAAELSPLLATALRHLGEAERTRMILAEARARLEASPGAGLVSVIAQQASSAILGLHYDLALERAEEAIALALALDLPAPYRALMARGEVRFGTDSRGGEEDYRRAIDEAEQQGDLHAASVAFYDLAAARGESFGPSASLATFDEGIDFSEEHGLHMEWMRVGRLQPLFLAGRWESLEEEAVAASRWAAERGDALIAHEADRMLAMIRLERGKPTGPLGVLVTAASDMGVSGAASAPAAAEAALVEGDREAALQILEGMLGSSGAGEVQNLARVVRTCLHAGEPAFARRALKLGAVPNPINDAETVAAEAMLAEIEGSDDVAREGFERAAASFAEFGMLVEEAYALDGLGRSLLALGDTDEGVATLHASRAIWVRLEATPRITEVEEVLARVS